MTATRMAQPSVSTKVRGQRDRETEWNLERTKPTDPMNLRIPFLVNIRVEVLPKSKSQGNQSGDGKQDHGLVLGGEEHEFKDGFGGRRWQSVVAVDGLTRGDGRGVGRVRYIVECDALFATGRSKTGKTSHRNGKSGFTWSDGRQGRTTRQLHSEASGFLRSRPSKCSPFEGRRFR